jgi:shikimate 5-dehydrogenase
VAIVGAGGTARAAGAALLRAGARVVLFNRSVERGRAAARKLGVALEPLHRLEDHRWEILVQATPLGGGGERVLPRGSLRGRMVLDAVYGRVTPLVREARESGLVVADGLDLLVAQALPQFRRMTGRACDEATLRQAGSAWLTARAVDLP